MTTFTLISTLRLVRRSIYPIALILAMAASISRGEVILSASPGGEFVGGPYLDRGIQDVALSFTLTNTFQNVSISIPLGVDENLAAPVTAYLTNKIGTGTTASANQIASGSYSPPYTGSNTSALVASTQLFTGLTLNPGTYYLVLTSTSADIGVVDWQNSVVTNTTTADGSSIGQSMTDLSLAEASYIPASNFGSSTSNLLFSISGNEAPVPEPGSCTLFLAGGAFLVFLRRRLTVTRR